MPFFKSLIAPHRLNNIHCQENAVYFAQDTDLEKTTSLKEFIEILNPDCYTPPITHHKNFMINLVALVQHGTLEIKMKEAGNYRNALGYIRFIIAFTNEAANNPQITAEEVLNKYFIMPPLVASRPAMVRSESIVQSETMEAG